MQKSLALFSRYKVSEPNYRRALYLHSSAQHSEENVLYMICCWDYIFNPTDEKIEGLKKVFLETGAPSEVNISSSNRKLALGLLGELGIADVIPSKGYGAGARGRLRSAAVFNRTAVRTGGIYEGGAGNYNLATKAIETSLPECMKQVEGSTQALTSAAKGGTGGVQVTKAGRKKGIAISDYWGAGIVKLGLGG